MPEPLVSFENVSLSFGSNRVLEDVSFEVNRGESVCAIGPNGGGKTTMLRVLLGLLEADSGKVSVFGQSPRKASPRIGYVPQAIRFDPLFPVTAMDIVLMGRLDRLGFGFFQKKCREVAKKALKDVGLDDRANSPFAKLSGGQRQRVLIARALASEPDLLLLDEPTANVDLSVEANLLDTLDELKSRLTILLVTHDLNVISRIGDSALCVNRRVHRHSIPLSNGTIREIYGGESWNKHDAEVRHKEGDHSSCDHD